jgi:succinate dehydrogenase / fumarate reductase cytochrome b subunit
MSLDRNVGLVEGLRYKGGGPMWAWILHRISGLGMIVFVSMHVAASFFTQQMGSDWAITLNIIYQSLVFQIFIYFCVIFHTINGARIIILDMWPKLVEYQREAIWFQWLIFIPIYGLTVFVMVSRAISGG